MANDGAKKQKDLLAALKRGVWLERSFGRDGVYRRKAKGAKSAQAAQTALDELAAQAAVCTACELHREAKQAVFGVGNPAADLMFVGEGPGEEEDRQGEPFVGRAGQLLTKIIRAMGFERADVYIANVVKHRPPKNRTPTKHEIAQCHHFLLAQLEIIRPKIICALGAPAAQTLLSTEKSIGTMRGKFHRYPDMPEILVMPTYHPAYLLRSPGEKGKVWEDMKKVMQELGKPVR